MNLGRLNQRDKSRTGSTEPDPRDVRIKELEQLLADQREQYDSLRKALDEARFQSGILEQSYSKQLRDANARCEAVEGKVTEYCVRVAELDQARSDAIELLTEARDELDRLTAEQRKLRQRLAAGGGSAGQDQGSDDSFMLDEGTINSLMDDNRWERARKEVETAQPAPDVEASPAAPAEDMLAPELVLAPGRTGD